LGVPVAPGLVGEVGGVGGGEGFVGVAHGAGPVLRWMGRF